ncbi:hypothetical protein ACWERY_30115 [Streptomyces sp. NPDC004082]|uniref:hypothetical protein n=1 Tax=unclassified Streptomyces TaxID=2593676 RepID=UPI0033A484FF
MGEKPDALEEPRRGRVDLSVPQVAGSAVAAVVAAKLASYFGVYGTILGAGVVSAIATCGGTVFQHFFKRTGEQLRDVTVQGRPGPSPGVRPRTAPPGQVARPAHEFGEATVHRARIKGWKRPLAAAVLVFGVAMAGISAYELVSGDRFGGGTGTTVGDALPGHGKSPGTPSRAPSPTPTPSDAGTPAGEAPSESGGGATVDSPAPTPPPTRTPDTGTDTGTEDEGTGDGGVTPAPSADATTPPAPDADSRSRSADPGPDGPAER